MGAKDLEAGRREPKTSGGGEERSVSLAGNIPDQKELEKELSDYLSKKYGNRIKIVSPILFPKSAAEEGEEPESPGPSGVERLHFDMKPEELEAHLDQYVIKQAQAKAVLATKICTHFNRIKHSRRQPGRESASNVGQIKNNIIMIGPTGVGKTYIIKLIAAKLGVPFVKSDATKFSETGYVGGDVEDLVRDLVHEADDDIELAQYGIIYIDEIDKIASSRNLVGPDVSRTGVQRALLKPMEETEVDLKVAHDPISQLQAIERYRKTGKREKRTINTRNILFIVSGAFGGLDEIIQKRLTEQGMGFGASLKSKTGETDYFKKVRSEDFINFGFESEFVGRLPVVVTFDELAAEDLYLILKNPNNPIINGKKRDFRAYGIEVRFENEALRLLAERAHEEKTGARGLVSAVERVLIGFEKKLPSTDIKQFLVTKEVVEEPEQELAKLLAGPDEERDHRFSAALESEKQALRDVIERRRPDFERRYGQLMTPRRTDMALDLMLKADSDIEGAYDELLYMYNQVRAYEVVFLERLGLSLQFAEDAVDEILARSISTGRPSSQICKALSQDLEFGLKLVRDKTGRDNFDITREAIENPEGYINRLIKESYRFFR
jgi:endopeptidase Clp ATP-binding regulatory subunit ClpX